MPLPEGTRKIEEGTPRRRWREGSFLWLKL
jgi:hypothetical protein